MFKTHLSINKYLLVLIGMTVVVISMSLINIVVLVPILQKVYAPQERKSQPEPIDTKMVNEAIKVLSE